MKLAHHQSNALILKIKTIKTEPTKYDIPEIMQPDSSIQIWILFEDKLSYYLKTHPTIR